MSKQANVPTTKVSLRVPEAIYDQYAERAMLRGRDAEDEMVTRLTTCREHIASTPIYMNDAQRNELCQITGKLIRNADELLAWARGVAALKVENVEVPLGMTLTSRLESRRFGTPWPEHVRATVLRCLESEVGLR